MGVPLTKQKALCVATRCTSAQQFIETFHRFCDEQSFFVATQNMRPVGLETPFSIQLANKTPVLQGQCVVLAAFDTAQNQYKRPGIRLGIRRLTPESETIFYQLQAMRTAAPQDVVTEASEAHVLPSLPPLPPVARPPLPVATRATPPPLPPKIEKIEERTPGSELVLPANPLQHLTDESIEGFVDCTLYEETANFFRAPEDDKLVDDVVPPPRPVVEVLPEFRPSAVIASAFPEEVPPEPSRDVEPTPAPTESSVVAQLARVEHSVARLVETLDTSRPIDEVARATPMPAGEAYARQVAKRAAGKRATWIVAAGALLVVGVAVVFVATRSSADAPPPVKQAKQVEPAPLPAPAPKPEPIVETKPEVVVDGDEVAAVTDPKTPAVGDGPCKLDVTTTPAGTMVKLDGETVGPSPITIGGPCTKRRVDLVHPRYKAEQRWVTLTDGKPGTLDVTLVRPTHTLTVVTTPPGATISINGRRAGTSPTKLSLMGFSGIDVKIEKTGFETVVKRVYSKRSDDALSVTLKRSLWLKK